MWFPHSECPLIRELIFPIYDVFSLKFFVDTSKRVPSKKESKKNKSKSNRLSKNVQEDEYPDGSPFTTATTTSSEPNFEKIRASTLREGSVVDQKLDTKPRSVSLADSLSRVNSTLRKMSTLEDDSEEVENIYQELEKELDQGGDSAEEGSEDETDHLPPALGVELPPPRNGCEKYAFHEMKEKLSYGESSIQDIDLKQISKQHSLEYNENEEFLAFSLLKSYVTSLAR